MSNNNNQNVIGSQEPPQPPPPPPPPQQQSSGIAEKLAKPCQAVPGTDHPGNCAATGGTGTVVAKLECSDSTKVPKRTKEYTDVSSQTDVRVSANQGKELSTQEKEAIKQQVKNVLMQHASADMLLEPSDKNTKTQKSEQQQQPKQACCGGKEEEGGKKVGETTSSSK